MEDIPERLGINETDFRLVVGISKIDYDKNKELINRKKHGYSLESGVDLLERMLFPIPSPPFIHKRTNIEGEARYQLMGVDHEGFVVFMITTMRPDETVRVISFRRASSEERELFRSLTGYVRTPMKAKTCIIGGLVHGSEANGDSR
ncbi:MAG: BrnT family toxin [Desulfobaccales bacterium]